MGAAGFLYRSRECAKFSASGSASTGSSRGAKVSLSGHATSTLSARPSSAQQRNFTVRCGPENHTNLPSDDVNSWRKKAFGSKPQEPGSTRSPRQEDYIDAEWQELQKRGMLSDAEPGAGSASGRSDVSNLDGFNNVEDSWDLADEYTPFPANIDPISKKRWSEGVNFSMAASSELWTRVKQVYVILFGVGKSETEGIYSLRAVTGSDGLPVDTIIAFQSEEDAVRYAGLLEAAMSRHVPEVSPIESKDLLDFCADSGYNCRLEPAGTLLMPPEYNVGMTDWERSLRLRDGHFKVLAEDPSPGEEPVGAQDPKYARSTPYEGPTLLNQAGTYFPTDNQELDEIKARLEKLLP